VPAPGLSAAVLLDVWDQGAGHSPVTQALALLAAAHPDQPLDQLQTWPVGRRDGALLALREALFGPQVQALATCPRCGERLDLSFALADVALPGPSDPAPPVTVARDGYHVTARLPDSRDLAAVSRASSPVAARATLLDRCVVESRQGDQALAPATLPPAVLADLEAALAAADPRADLQLAVQCAACGHAWEIGFDIGAFLWTELEAWAGRVLRDVHTLATAYGWSESAILALSPRRRQYYLDLVTG
jgi:hypothetical protein